jgi:hypothetical protein
MVATHFGEPLELAQLQVARAEAAEMQAGL